MLDKRFKEIARIIALDEKLDCRFDFYLLSAYLSNLKIVSEIAASIAFWFVGNTAISSASLDFKPV